MDHAIAERISVDLLRALRGRRSRAAFSKRLAHAGFAVSEHVVRPHRAGKGPRHVIWIAA